jgi:hypothetical protein
MKSPGDHLDLAAAEPAIGIRHELGALADAHIVPTHARLPDPLLDVRHVIVDARIDVAEDLLPLHDATSFRRVQARPRGRGCAAHHGFGDGAVADRAATVASSFSRY